MTSHTECNSSQNYLGKPGNEHWNEEQEEETKTRTPVRVRVKRLERGKEVRTPGKGGDYKVKVKVQEEGKE